MARIAPWFLAAILWVSGCTSTSEPVRISKVAGEGPKVVAVSAPRQPWVVEIEDRLRSRGYVIEQLPDGQLPGASAGTDGSAADPASSTRMILYLVGQASTTTTTTCVGRGVDFQSIDAELVDARTGETVADYSNAGGAEGCTPLSATIYADIVRMVDDSFLVPAGG